MAIPTQEIEALATRLLTAHPKLDPRTLGFSQLAKLVHDAGAVSEASSSAEPRKLEAIQEAWYALYPERLGEGQS